MSAKRYAVNSGSREAINNTRRAIRNREEFETSGALRGTTLTTVHCGMLGRKARDAYVDELSTIDYAVFSYRTPIAWHTPDGWTVVTDKFSPTTISHQSAVTAALHGYFEPGNEPIEYRKVRF